MSNTDVMETAPAVNAETLAKILDTAQRLYVDAEWLQIDAYEVLSDLQEVVENPAVHGSTALAEALDSATWLSRAAENVQAEFSSLIDHLHTATEA
jgi:hypothetical protein